MDTNLVALELELRALELLNRNLELELRERELKLNLAREERLQKQACEERDIREREFNLSERKEARLAQAAGFTPAGDQRTHSLDANTGFESMEDWLYKTVK